jgi:hypothetical protein
MRSAFSIGSSSPFSRDPDGKTSPKALADRTFDEALWHSQAVVLRPALSESRAKPKNVDFEAA